MRWFEEITEWNEDTPNHTYLMDEGRSKMFAYVQVGSRTPKVFSKPIAISVRGRKFKEVVNRWGYIHKEELVQTGETHRVPGSKGAVYTVTNDQGSWTCTCPASKWQKNECKHITALKAQQPS